MGSDPPAEEQPPPSAEAASSGAGAGAGWAAPQIEERYGPLRLLRARKDDGRALLLFSQREGRGEDDAPGGPESA
jgi:hypothetical protein